MTHRTCDRPPVSAGVAARLFHPETGLFEQYPDGSGRYRLSVKNEALWDLKVPGINGETARDCKTTHLAWCEFAGNFMGTVFFDGHICPARL